MKNNQLYFKEATTQSELLALLKLRYKGYQNSKLTAFCNKNQSEIDLDEYDTNARHFGLYQKGKKSIQPIGYIRMIQESTTSIAPHILSIAKKNSQELWTKANIQTTTPFPLMNYFPGAKKVVTKINKECKQRGGKLFEASRLVLLSEYRSLGLAKFMIEAVSSIYFYAWDFTDAVICCSKAHSKIYQYYGFESLKMLGEKSVADKEGIPVSLVIMIKRAKLREKFMAKFKHYGKSFLDNQAISVDAATNLNARTNSKLIAA